MPDRHLNLATLERFVASDLDSQAMNAVGRHLFTCASCRARLRADISGGAEVLQRLRRKGWEQAEAPADYDDIFERLQLSTLDRIQKAEEERARAPKLFSESL